MNRQLTFQLDSFHQSGPTHLSNPDWTDPNCKRAILACLVKGVYVLEKDRQAGRERADAIAPPWWTSFNYRSVQILRDTNGLKIVGVVCEWNNLACPLRPVNAPMAIIALRGTMLYGEALRSDLKADLHLFLQKLHTTSRFTSTLEVVRKTVEDCGVENVCIAGHSLGAALGMLAGRVLAEEGLYIDAYLFNPPYASPPLDRIKSRKLLVTLQVMKMVAVAGLTSLLHTERRRKEALDAFLALKNWIPHLHVNAQDVICSSYIGYFATRQYMLDIGGVKLVQLAAPHSLRGILHSSIVRKSRPYHLLPSAHLSFIHKNESEKFRQAHGLQQWWSAESDIHHYEASFDINKYTEQVGTVEHSRSC